LAGCRGSFRAKASAFALFRKNKNKNEKNLSSFFLPIMALMSCPWGLEKGVVFSVCP
jgi:hypothetical protein